MNKIYTGIGSRETPADVLELMTRIGVRMAQYGWTLRSGHAPGADQAFERGALWGVHSGYSGKREIYLPWDGFEKAWHDGKNYFTPSKYAPDDVYSKAEAAARHFHPAWDKLTDGGKKLQVRNGFQVAGWNLDLKSDCVICWTKGGQPVGGTGQAIRMAKYFNIPVFNLATCNQQQLLDFINYGRLS